MAEGCIFCSIVAGSVPATIVHETKYALAFRDINAMAPTHILVVPRRHVASMDELEPGEESVLTRMFEVARDVAKAEGLSDGYRVVINTGEDGGQTVGHLHLHLLGGRRMKWPPG